MLVDSLAPFIEDMHCFYINSLQTILSLWYPRFNYSWNRSISSCDCSSGMMIHTLTSTTITTVQKTPDKKQLSELIPGNYLESRLDFSFCWGDRSISLGRPLCSWQLCYLNLILFDDSVRWIWMSSGNETTRESDGIRISGVGRLPSVLLVQKKIEARQFNLEVVAQFQEHIIFEYCDRWGRCWRLTSSHLIRMDHKYSNSFAAQKATEACCLDSSRDFVKQIPDLIVVTSVPVWLLRRDAKDCIPQVKELPLGLSSPQKNSEVMFTYALMVSSLMWKQNPNDGGSVLLP